MFCITAKSCRSFTLAEILIMAAINAGEMRAILNSSEIASRSATGKRGFGTQETRLCQSSL